MELLDRIKAEVVEEIKEEMDALVAEICADENAMKRHAHKPPRERIKAIQEYVMETMKPTLDKRMEECLSSYESQLEQYADTMQEN